MSDTDFFDLRPSAVNRWLDGLPLASIGETARQLYVAMRTVNRMEAATAKDIFHFMERVSEPLALILPELHRHYVGKPLPLSPKRRKVADLYTQLLRQAIEGYQRLISFSIALNRFGWKKVVTTAVHRIFYYQTLMLCNYRLLYQPFPRGTWQQTYWLFLLIAKHELLDSKVQGMADDGQKSTLESEFKKLLLITLLSPNLFKPAELQVVLQHMGLWLSYTDITDARPADISHVYAFLPDTDMSPGLLTTDSERVSPQAQIYYFDIGRLIHFMHDKLAAAAAPGTMISLARKEAIEQRILLLLLNNWGRPPARDGERRAIAGQAELAIGLSAIHYLLGEGRANVEPATTPRATAAIAGSSRSDLFSIDKTGPGTPGNFSALGFATQRDEARDVWDTALFEPEPLPPAWTESIRMKAYTYLPIRILNVSKGGFCISIPQDSIEQIQIGELVALRGKTGQWQLGEIRWMVCPTNGPIRAGVKRLCNRVEHAQLHFTSKQQPGQPIRVLVGEHDQGKSLYVPRLPTRLEDRSLALEYKGGLQPCHLTSTLNNTLLGYAYTLQLQAEKQHTTAAGSNNTKSDHFAQVWASL